MIRYFSIIDTSAYGYMDINTYVYNTANLSVWLDLSAGFDLGINIVGSTYCNSDLIVILEFTRTTDEPTVAVATVEELNGAYEQGVQSA